MKKHQPYINAMNKTVALIEKINAVVLIVGFVVIASLISWLGSLFLSPTHFMWLLIGCAGMFSFFVVAISGYVLSNMVKDNRRKGIRTEYEEK